MQFDLRINTNANSLYSSIANHNFNNLYCFEKLKMTGFNYGQRQINNDSSGKKIPG
jgi:hypothetical protein